MLSARVSFLATIRRLPSSLSSSSSSVCVSASFVSSTSPATAAWGGTRFLSNNNRLFSSEPNGSDSYTSSTSPIASSLDTNKYITGTVKFYGRQKCYGFIIPDNVNDIPNNADEIWVHRTSFDTPIPADDSPKRPYLHAGERVKFQLEEAPIVGVSNDENHMDLSTGGESPKPSRPKAINLVFENGQQIPLFRKK